MSVGKILFLLFIILHSFSSVFAGDEPTPEFCLGLIHQRNTNANANVWVTGLGSGTILGIGLLSGYETYKFTEDRLKSGRTGEAMGTMFIGGIITAYFMLKANEMVGVAQKNAKRGELTGSLLDLASYFEFVPTSSEADPKKGEKVVREVVKFVQAQDPGVSTEEIVASVKQQFFKFNCGYFFQKYLVYQANDYFMANSPEEMAMQFISQRSFEQFKAQSAIEDSERQAEKKRKESENSEGQTTTSAITQ